MRFGILGTGIVGKTITTRLAGLGHEVMVGTRDPQETMSRTEPDRYGNPPFNAWQKEHREVSWRLRRSGSPQRDGSQRHCGC